MADVYSVMQKHKREKEQRDRDMYGQKEDGSWRTRDEALHDDVIKPWDEETDWFYRHRGPYEGIATKSGELKRNFRDLGVRGNELGRNLWDQSMSREPTKWATEQYKGMDVARSANLASLNQQGNQQVAQGLAHLQTMGPVGAQAAERMQQNQTRSMGGALGNMYAQDQQGRMQIGADDARNKMMLQQSLNQQQMGSDRYNIQNSMRDVYRRGDDQRNFWEQKMGHWGNQKTADAQGQQQENKDWFDIL